MTTFLKLAVLNARIFIIIPSYIFVKKQTGTFTAKL